MLLKQGVRGELNPPFLLPTPTWGTHIHPEEGALSPEIGRGDSLVENCLASATGTHTRSVRLPLWSQLHIGEAISQICWGWPQNTGLPAIPQSDRCTLEQFMVLTNGQHMLYLSFWSMSGLDAQDPHRWFCGDSYPFGPYSDMVPELTITCTTKPVPLGWTSQTLLPLQWRGLTTMPKSRESQKENYECLHCLSIKKKIHWWCDSRLEDPNFPETELVPALCSCNWVWTF